jgi:hypothetical protein
MFSHYVVGCVVSRSFWQIFKKKNLRGLSPRANYTTEQLSLVGEICANF